MENMTNIDLFAALRQIHFLTGTDAKELKKVHFLNQEDPRDGVLFIFKSIFDEQESQIIIKPNGSCQTDVPVLDMSLKEYNKAYRTLSKI